VGGGGVAGGLEGGGDPWERFGGFFHLGHINSKKKSPGEILGSGEGGNSLTTQVLGKNVEQRILQERQGGVRSKRHKLGRVTRWI